MMMIKFKLAADIFLSIAWLTIVVLGTILREWVLVSIAAALTLTFTTLIWYDIVKLDNDLPKYIISLGNGSYYDGYGGCVCRPKAKVYRSIKAAGKAANRLATIDGVAKFPTIEEE